MRHLLEQLQNLDKSQNYREIGKPIVNYWNYIYNIQDVYPIIVCLNINGKNFKHTLNVYESVQKYKPHIIFTIENWKEYPNINNYTKFTTNDCYMNCLFIRNDIVRNRSVNKIPYGFRFDDICFRYCKPGCKKTELFQNEIGDYNFNSNTWIDNSQFFREDRRNKPGGMGFRLNKKFTYEFFTTSSDHDGIAIKILENWKMNKLADKRKVELAIKDIVYNYSDEFGYIYKFSNNYKYKHSDKIINPNIFPLDDWKKLYRHNNIKNTQQSKDIGYYGSITKPLGTNAYDANNRPIKMITDTLKNMYISHDVLQRCVDIFAKDNFEARVVCLKKHKEVESLKDIRPIVIEPISMKIRERTREVLKTKLSLRIDSRIYSFIEGKSTTDAIQNIIYDLRRGEEVSEIKWFKKNQT